MAFAPEGTNRLKPSARVATTANIADLAAGAPDPVDGVSLSVGDRVLVINQSTGSENGTYRVVTVGTGSDGAWVRSDDTDQDAEVNSGDMTYVREGTQAGLFHLTTVDPITVGSTAQVFDVVGINTTGTPVDNQVAVWDSAGSLEGDSNLTWDAALLTVTGNATVTSLLTASGGITAPSTGTASESYGASASTGADSALAVGNSASAATLRSVAIGVSASTVGQDSVAIGFGATTGTDSVAIGRIADCNGNQQVCIGEQAVATATGNSPAIAIGRETTAATNSVALGNGATAAANEFVVGSAGFTITDVYFGQGVTDATPPAYTVHGTGGSGTDIAGADITIAGGIGTGTGVSGEVVVQTAPAGSTGATPNTLIERLRFAATEVAFNDTGADIDTRFEGVTRPDLLLIDAGVDRVGINRTAGNAAATLDIDNLAVAESIFIVRDSGTPVFTIADGGPVTATALVTVSGGITAPSTGAPSEAFGAGASTGDANSVAVGPSASAAGRRNVAIGSAASSSGDDSIAIGSGSVANASGVSIGRNAVATGNQQILIGEQAVGISGGGAPAIAIGRTASAATNAVALGEDVAALANEFVAGGAQFIISDVYFGTGSTAASPGAYTIHGTGGSGTDVAGADLTIAGGIGTGTGAGGDVVIQTAPAGSTSSTPNTLIERLRFAEAEVVFNETGVDHDFRVEGVGETNALVVQGSDGFVGIGTGTPVSRLHVEDTLDGGVSTQVKNLSTGTQAFAVSSAVGDAAGVAASIFAFGSGNTNTTFGISQANAVGWLASTAVTRMFIGPQGTAAALEFGTATNTNINRAIVIGANAGPIVFNEEGIDMDTRFEGNTRPNLLLIDAGLDRVGINRTAGNAGATLDVDNLAVAESIFILRDNGTPVLTIADGGAATFTQAITLAADSTNLSIGASSDLTLSHNGTDSIIANATGDLQINGVAASAVVFNEAGADIDFRVEGSGQSDALFVQGSNGNVGIGDGSPTNAFEVLRTAGNCGVGVTTSDASGSAFLFVSGNGAASEFIQLLSDSAGNAQLLFQPGSGGIAEISHGATVATDLQINGANGAAIVFNENDEDVNLRIEGLTRPNLFFVDAGQDRIGINRTTGNVGATLDIDNLAVAEPILILRDNGVQVLALPDGIGAGLAGQQLWSSDDDGTMEWGGPNNPTRVVSHYDDFLTYQAGGWWDETLSGAGTAAATTGGTALGGGAAGVLELDAGTTTSGAARIEADAIDGLANYDKFVFEARVRFEDLSTGSEEFISILGSFGADGAYFTYDRTTSTSWLATSIEGSSTTEVAVGAAVTADTWYNLKWIYDPTTPSIEFFLDGVSVTTSTTNIADSAATALAGMRASITKTAGTTSRTMYVDYISFYGYLNADR